jgi:excisionase family DNA binding protein
MPPLSVSTAYDRARMPDEVVTIMVVAAPPKLSKKTVYAMANAGEIPTFEIRGQWRIKAAELDPQLDAHHRGCGDEVYSVRQDAEFVSDVDRVVEEAKRLEGKAGPNAIGAGGATRPGEAPIRRRRRP